MVNSSPEFSITKPGLHHHFRKRDKPLRTYGRQTSTPEAQSGPPLKKQRISSFENQENESSSSALNKNDVANSDDVAVKAAKQKQDASYRNKPEETRAQSPVKGSIMNYFKPAPKKPKIDPPSQPQTSQPKEPITSQATPQRKLSSKRKPRLLKINPISNEPSPQEQEQEQEPHNSNSCRPLQKTATPNAPPETASSSTSPSPSPRKSSRIPKPRSSPSVQTTLNISAQAPFSECKICDTVWNPLYPDDVKFHNKTHKAVLRAQKRKLDDGL